MIEFQKFGKIPRLSRDVVITEKIDGTNAQIFIVRATDFLVDYDGDQRILEEQEFIDKFCLYKTLAMTDENDILYVFAGSRTRWLDTSSKGDNYGFAKWVQANAEELLKLGEGHHYGEWWGQGIQRRYDLEEKRLSLFNVGKWVKKYNDKGTRFMLEDNQQYCPECCSVVPILYNGMFDTTAIDMVIEALKSVGSQASKGFMNPEGIIIYHTASGKLFKKTVKDDEKRKGK